MTENPLVEQSTESQNTASESLENQGLQQPKIDLGGKYRFERLDEVTWKLTDGKGSNAWAVDRSGNHRTTRAIAWLMGIGSGKWIARYRNKWSKAMTLAKAKQYALEMVKGIRPGRVPADPIRHLHLETLRAMGESPVITPARRRLRDSMLRRWLSPDAGLLAKGIIPLLVASADGNF
jgi:hypothetical protein